MNQLIIKRIKISSIVKGKIEVLNGSEISNFKEIFQNAGIDVNLPVEDLKSIAWMTNAAGEGVIGIIDNDDQLWSLDVPDGVWYNLLGTYYGYPQCCIDALWSPRPSIVSRHPIIGTGYVPCPQCATKSREELIGIITANRHCPLPFPNDGETNFDSLLKYYQTNYTLPKDLKHAAGLVVS